MLHPSSTPTVDPEVPIVIVVHAAYRALEKRLKNTDISGQDIYTDY